MKRVLLILASIVGIAVIAALAVGALLFNTGVGRSFIIAQAEPIIGKALGGDAEIGSLSGDLPGLVIFNDIVLTDRENVWATIETVELDWRPFRLIHNQLNINRLSINSAHLLREPPQKPKQDNEEFETLSLKLPGDLPIVTIADFGIVNLQSNLGGETVRLDGGGTFQMRGRRINANLNLTSQNDRDNAHILIDLMPGADRVFIDATIAAPEDGVIAAFVGLGEPLFLEIKSDSMLRAAEISVNGTIGAYGDIDATLTANLEKLSAVDISATFSAGNKLSDIKEFAQPVAITARLEQNQKSGTLNIEKLTSAIGELDGVINWTNARNGIASVNTDINIAFDEIYRNGMQAYTSDKLNFISELRPRRKNYDLKLTVKGDGFGLAIENGTTDLSTSIAGDLIAAMEPRQNLSFPPSSATLAGGFEINVEEIANLHGFELTLEDGASANGSGTYSFEEQTISFDGEVRATPGFISTFTSAFQPVGSIDAIIALSGTASRFTLISEIETPQIMIGEESAPPLTIIASLAGLPNLPTGDISARAKTGAGKFDAILRSSEDGEIRIPALSYTGPGFDLKGSGAYAPKPQSLTFDLVYAGGDNAEPWPGFPLTGAVTAKGIVARQADETSVIINADKLWSKEIAVSGLTVTASGTPDAIETTLKVEAIAKARTGPVDGLTATAIISVRDAPTILLTSLNATVTDSAIALREPVTISFNDGVKLDNLRINWGPEGRIFIDGEFSSARWRADARLFDVNVPQTDGRISANIYLDTNEPIPARGAVELRSLIAQTAADSIKFGVVWNGETLKARSASDENALDMTLSLPMQLIKSPTLSVSTSGALNGYLRYDGAIEPLAAYLPPELQTLEGALITDFTIGGSTSNPEISGTAQFTDGAYTELQSGLSLSGLHSAVTASYNGSGSLIRFDGGALDAASDKDMITINGELKLDDASRLDLKIQLDGAALSVHPVRTIRADGEINISGPLDEITATGDVNIIELNAEIITPESTGLAPITVIAFDETNGTAEALLEAPPSTSIDYDIKITADDRIFIRGRGLESEWSANIQAVDDKQAALITGQMVLQRGWLDFSGRRFELSRGAITFDRLAKNNPLLDIRAEHETSNNVTAVIAISGRARKPAIELTSTPSLPPEDIMALVLFGKEADSLTAVESLQTAQALASIGGIGPFGGSGLTGSLRQATGLDLLNFDIDPENGGGSLTVGKYVADGLFVSATQDAKGESGAVRVEYDITNNISVETEIKQNGDQTVSANWKKDF